MSKQKVPRTRNNNTMTEAGYNNFIRGVLRAGTKRWKPRTAVKKEAEVGRKINVLSGRMAKHYECSVCKGHFPNSLVEVHHVEPVIGEEGFVSWDVFIERLYSEKDNLTVVCKECHKKEG